MSLLENIVDKWKLLWKQDWIPLGMQNIKKQLNYKISEHCAELNT